MLDQDKTQQLTPYGNTNPTPTYANGRSCIIGDAAHTTSPYQGAGGGLAVEDAFGPRESTKQNIIS
ncbi:hypothetical protein GGS20DRAFT_526921 [Poronia punctata]|nr:hypothetical protein GGS20DRAFT_526921 [Poronia punctata]